MKEQREIKFKIWDNEKKRMSKPLPVFHPFVEWSDGDIEMPTDFAIVKSERFIFLQYTGLKDINEKEIYEGDIVNVHLFTQTLGHNLGVSESEEIHKGVIEFWDYGIALNAGDDENNFYLTLAPSMLHEESFEVIGSVYDITSLIKKETA